MNLPNTITLIRIALIPVFMLTVPPSGEYGLAPFIIFAVASVTDGIDGAIARKYGLVTSFGKFIDPLADKLLVTAALSVFAVRGQMAAWAILAVLAREFIITSLRLVAVEKGVVIAAKLSGKIKTFTQIVCILVMMTPLRLVTLTGIPINDLAVFFMVTVTLLSGVDYIWSGRKLL